MWKSAGLAKLLPCQTTPGLSRPVKVFAQPNNSHQLVELERDIYLPFLPTAVIEYFHFEASGIYMMPSVSFADDSGVLPSDLPLLPWPNGVLCPMSSKVAGHAKSRIRGSLRTRGILVRIAVLVEGLSRSF
jgi:hypothetical protein